MDSRKILERIDKFTVESTYGKEKSKDWFKFRGMIAGVKNSKEMQSLLKMLEKSWKSKQISKDELTDLTNQALAKSARI